MMSTYQTEQKETLAIVYQYINALNSSTRQKMVDTCDEYLKFRADVDAYLSRYFDDICTKECFESELSACCARESIITFFADVVINALFSNTEEIAYLMTVLEGEGIKHKCIYLGKDGCLWRIKPIVCEMFLCDKAQENVFGARPERRDIWEDLKAGRKAFTWPDKPVLFDELEIHFRKAGISSPLMYFNNSPGLLRVKQMAKAKQ